VTTTRSLAYAIVPEKPDTASRKYEMLWGIARNTALSDKRSPGMADHDKILYSHAWRRLAGVTQIITPDEEDIVLHTRLTHSEKVAQLSRSIALSIINRSDQRTNRLIGKLGGLDAHMAQAAGLAHDLGHPPFGHVAEKVLDSVARDHGLEDGFEGNAQTFRTLIQIARWDRRASRRGLRMTRGTFAAVLKYPWLRGPSLDEKSSPVDKLHWDKFGAYLTESRWFDEARSWVPLAKNVPTLEASVMDLADEITYAVHDLFDFAGYGLIDLRESLERLQDGWRVFDDAEVGALAALHPGYFGPGDVEAAHDWLTWWLAGVREFVPRMQAPAIPELAASRITSELLDDFINGCSVREEPFWAGGPHLSLDRRQFHNLYILKQFTLAEALRMPMVAAQQRTAKPLVHTCHEVLLEWALKDPESLPADLRARLRVADRGTDEISKSIGRLPGVREMSDADVAGIGSPCRLITDYVAGLTDHAARSLYRLITPPGVEPVGRGISL